MVNPLVGGLAMTHHLSIGRGVPTAERAGDQQQQLLVFQVGSVIVLHAHHLHNTQNTNVQIARHRLMHERCIP